jgi:hypothetical protein
VEARRTWILCLLHDGDKSAAEEVFKSIEALRPANIGALRAWFVEELKPRR